MQSIVYIYPSRSTFILRDVEILGATYDVKAFHFKVEQKKKLPLEFIRQFFFLLRHLRKAEAAVCHFAGFASFLPVLLCKLYRKPCLVIVAGSDAAKFPSFNYGNFTRGLYAYVTRISLKKAAHILPVHESLYYQDYDYYENGAPAQGYAYFCPEAKNVPYTPVYYGYDASAFRIDPTVNRKPNTFVTIGNFSDPKAARRKGCDLIIDLAKRCSDFTFTIVGWNMEKPVDLPANLNLLPFTDQTGVIRALNENQFYFQLSIMEGFPNALAEAMLCGCIPIGSNVSGIPYIINGQGFVLKHRNIDELVEITDEIRGRSQESLAKLSFGARERVATEFTLENRKNKIIQIIQSFNSRS